MIGTSLIRKAAHAIHEIKKVTIREFREMGEKYAAKVERIRLLLLAGIGVLSGATAPGYCGLRVVIETYKIRLSHDFPPL